VPATVPAPVLSAPGTEPVLSMPVLSMPVPMSVLSMPLRKPPIRRLLVPTMPN
jgi:hypothetical protein